jgi:hypothetical protein
MSWPREVRARALGIVQAMEMRVTDTRGKLLDNDLVGTWIRQLDLFDDHGLCELHVHGRERLRKHGLPPDADVG